MLNEEVKHLYWRAEFGIPSNKISQVPKNRKVAIRSIFKNAQRINRLQKVDVGVKSLAQFQNMSKDQKRAVRKRGREKVKDLNIIWIEQMVRQPSLREKMAFFWHGHFACELKNPVFAVNQINTIKKHALGNFRDLVLGIAQDAAMILYLNNQQNRKSKPNENFARELLELFTIGRGNYTEQDIKEAARAFTGWFANRLTGEFQFRERAHDKGQKTFMGKTGNWNGDDIINIILSRKETAHFIASKLYRFFVNENSPNEGHIDDLANTLFRSNYDIEKTMRYLFEQDWFYAKENRGSKIKSPVELIVGMMQTLQLDFKNQDGILFTQKALGQILFRPPNVAGWAGGKTWIDNATLLMRLNYAGYIFNQAEVAIEVKTPPETKPIRVGRKIDVKANLSPLVKSFSQVPKGRLADSLANYLLQCPAKLDKSIFENYANSASSSRDRVKAWVISLMSLPEYQMC